MDEPKFKVGDQVAKPLKRGKDRGTIRQVYYSYTVEWDSVTRHTWCGPTNTSEEMEQYIDLAPLPSPIPKFKLGEGVKWKNSKPEDSYWGFGIISCIIITELGIDYEVKYPISETEMTTSIVKSEEILIAI
jgi:hypothetical protein